MKTLQSNYTTPEQSKRLLELGLPADSADCYYRDFASSRVRLIPNIRETDDKFGIDTNFLIPCWSVGRLMEIHDICIEDEDAQYGWAPAGDYNYIDYIISRFEEEIIYFFKLEK